MNNKPGDLRKEFINDLMTYRRRRWQSQADLAKMFGVHPMTVSRWERGTVMPPGPAFKLLKILLHEGWTAEVRGQMRVIIGGRR